MTDVCSSETIQLSRFQEFPEISKPTDSIRNDCADWIRLSRS